MTEPILDYQDFIESLSNSEYVEYCEFAGHAGEFAELLRSRQVETVTLKMEEFLDETFTRTVVNLVNPLREGLITVDEFHRLVQDAATWFDILVD